MNRISVAQEHYCTAITQSIRSRLYPLILQNRRASRTFIGASVAGELHEIGIRMVSEFLEMDGWDTHYMGANTPAKGIISTAIDRQASVIGISATMTYHLGHVRDLIRQIRQEPRCGRMHVVVGGYAFNLSPKAWVHTGADGFATDAVEASSLVKSFALQH